MVELRLGILGMSEGNGHPYSWSAIFNGYEPAAMRGCPFPAIPDYLAKRRFPDDAIPGAKVTHIWTQDPVVSHHVADAARIANVVNRPEAMIGNIDALLLARDDAPNHLTHAAPFLRAGLPVYVDKPVALDAAAARALYAAQIRPGQIFTCSAIDYGVEFHPPAEALTRIGRIRHAEAVTIKDWDRYAVHVIEPLLRLLGPKGAPVSARADGAAMRTLDLRWADGVSARITALGTPHGPISIRLYGETGWLDLTFSDAFSAFRAALAAFVDIVRDDAPPQTQDGPMAVVGIIELGRRMA